MICTRETFQPVPTDAVRWLAPNADFYRVQQAMQGTVWTSGGCASWYLDQSGKNTTLWPGFTWRFRRETRRFDPGEYLTQRAAPRREVIRV